jgi:hypothetical protein
MLFYGIKEDLFDLMRNEKRNMISSQPQVSLPPQNPYGRHCDYNYLNWAISNLIQHIQGGTVVPKDRLVEFLDIFYNPSIANSSKWKGSFDPELWHMREENAFERSYERLDLSLESDGYKHRN